jgi:hypothetical protein
MARKAIRSEAKRISIQMALDASGEDFAVGKCRLRESMRNDREDPWNEDAIS